MYGASGTSKACVWQIGRIFDPKLTAAQALWVHYPSEIAADLRREYGVRIADWHTGAMSSHELLELLQHCDDDGALKTALREGEPSDRRRQVMQIANELAVLRAIQAPDLDGRQWQSQFWLTPAKLRELSEPDPGAGARAEIMSIGAIP